MDQTEHQNLQSSDQFLKKILSHTMDKNCIFLLCNGILMILAKTSGFIRSSSATDLDDQSVNKKNGGGLQLSPEMNDSLLQKKVLVETTENVVVEEEREDEYSIEEKTENTNLMVEDHEEQEAGNGLLINTGGEGREEETGTSVTEVEEISEKDLDSDFQEEEEGLFSAEELNKKFDDFIRRMKQEMRIEAQQQLIMV
ncbi:hypothetical protein F0562_009979 [Nyssa sinensis]|uniref:DUF4408 domain-containing protein n=1 Tax=Nyssa sinensis TaxID=561372 RepID=A0A5J5A0F2_9ASTE|nr:hypothetical protein F0562_009979 [Nyssa sinensis]